MYNILYTLQDFTCKSDIMRTFRCVSLKRVFKRPTPPLRVVGSGKTKKTTCSWSASDRLFSSKFRQSIVVNVPPPIRCLKYKKLAYKNGSLFLRASKRSKTERGCCQRLRLKFCKCDFAETSSAGVIFEVFPKVRDRYSCTTADTKCTKNTAVFLVSFRYMNPEVYFVYSLDARNYISRVPLHFSGCRMSSIN